MNTVAKRWGLAVLAIGAVTLPFGQSVQAAGVEAAEVDPKVIPNDFTGTAANPQAATDCNLCYTCGGDWPVFAGVIHTGGGTYSAFERASACSGSGGWRTDQYPYLCCKD